MSLSLLFFGAWAAVVVGVVRKSRQMPSSAVQQIAIELDPPAVVSVWNVWAAAAAATAAAAAGQIARTKYLMLIFVKSKMSLRANLANKSANYKCPKIDEQARRVTSQLLSRGADPTGTKVYVYVCLSIMLISQLSCAGISIS